MPPKLLKVTRLDSLPMGQTQFTDEGFLVDRPILTSIGIFEYQNNDGSVRRELRLPEDVFDPESLASYKGKPIVITHDAGLIDKNNVASNQIGTILSEGYRSGDDVRAEIIIHDTDEMKKSRFKELSLGYNLDLDETPGEWEGQHYDAIQRNIRINHLALVQNARAGEQARLNIDSRDSITILKGGKQMSKSKKTTRNDGQLSPEELAKAIAEYKAKRAKENQEVAKDADDEEEKEVITSEPTLEAVGDPTDLAPEKEEEKKEDADDEEETEVTEPAAPVDAEEEKPVEDQVKEIRERHDDDYDVQKLCDIIDTLIAEKEFDAADDETEEIPALEEEKKEEIAEDNAPVAGVDDIEKMKKDADDDKTEEDNPDLTDDFDFEDEKENEDEADEEEEEEKKPFVAVDCDDAEKKLNMDSIDAIVRARIQLGLVGRKLNMDGLENLGIMDAKKAIIKAVRPAIRLDGKSKTYINALYQLCADDVNTRTTKNTNYQKKQMFNKDSADVVKASSKTSADTARENMIARQRNVSK